MKTNEGVKHPIEVKGRTHLIQLHGRGGAMDILNIHSNPNPTLTERARQIRRAWDMLRNSKYTLRCWEGNDLHVMEKM